MDREVREGGDLIRPLPLHVRVANHCGRQRARRTHQKPGRGVRLAEAAFIAEEKTLAPAQHLDRLGLVVADPLSGLHARDVGGSIIGQQDALEFGLLEVPSPPAGLEHMTVFRRHRERIAHREPLEVRGVHQIVRQVKRASRFLRHTREEMLEADRDVRLQVGNLPPTLRRTRSGATGPIAIGDEPQRPVGPPLRGALREWGHCGHRLKREWHAAHSSHPFEREAAYTGLPSISVGSPMLRFEARMKAAISACRAYRSIWR